MTRRLEQRALEIVAKAARLRPDRRAALVNAACANSPLLRQEVGALLSQYKQPGRFLGLYSPIDHRRFSHFEVYELISSGGEGAVYRGRDVGLRRFVALKTIHPWAIGHSAFRHLILRGAQFASLVSHPNVVTIYETGRVDGVDFLAMEWVSGATLAASIPRRGLSVWKALQYATQITSGMMAVHRAGILHGDLKPTNILVTAEGQVKLTDFGQARIIEKNNARTPRFKTPAYSAPEQREHQSPLTVRSEIYTCGLILFEMITGLRVFETCAGDRDFAQGPRFQSFLEPLITRVPGALISILRRCLDIRPRKRYGSMKELWAALAEAGSMIQHTSAPSRIRAAFAS